MLMSRMKNLIEVRGLKKYFPTGASFFGAGAETVKAVDDVSFTIRRGETFGLVGESGCGKSTTGRCILRLIEPTAGEVDFDGRDLLAVGRERVAKAPPRYADNLPGPLFVAQPSHEGGQIIEEPLAIHRVGSRRERRDRVAELLGLVGLSRSTPSATRTNFPAASGSE